jgi:ATP-dependent DNA helicase PIF1
MLRNISEPRLCNDRLAVTKLMNVTEIKILKGKYKGEEVLIPRINLIPNDMPFYFKRLQFPVQLVFAMSINKSQRELPNFCGFNLENPCFSYGKLYVAYSHDGIPTKLFIYAQEKK